MTQRLYELPTFTVIADMGSELADLQTAFDVTTENERMVTTLGEYMLTAHQAKQTIETTHSAYYKNQFTWREIEGGELAPHIAPFFSTVTEHEKTLSQQDGEIPRESLLLSTTGSVLMPNQEGAKSWHTGDPRRYIAALGLTTEFVVGDFVLPKNLNPKFLECISPKFIVGEAIAQILAETGELPEGLAIARPRPGELVRIDERHAHRTPVNRTASPLKRQLLTVDP